MNKEEALTKLREIYNEGRYEEETAHRQADIVLCDLLETLGYKEVVEAYDRIDKWYA